MTKMTREQKREQQAAEIQTKRVHEYRDSFLKDRARRVYTREAAFKAHDNGDNSGMAIYELLGDIRHQRETLKGRMESAMRSLTEGLERLAANDPRVSSYSNGVLGNTGHEVDQLSFELAVAVKACATMAWGGGWRVREIESTMDREFHDTCARLEVVPFGEGFGIRLIALEPGEKHGWFYPLANVAPLDSFGPEGFFYDTEELAWSAICLLVTGRSL